MSAIAQKNVARGEIAHRIAQAARDAAHNISCYRAWQDLDILSSATEVDDIEVFESEIFLEGNRFIGSCNIYVTLVYFDEEEEIRSPDSFPGRFEGKLHGDKPQITELTVDTSSFYE